MGERGGIRLMAGIAAVAACLLLSDCAPEAASTSPSPIAATPTPKGSPSQKCPSSEGGVCLGEVPAGTYSTKSFRPRLTYTVPDGWSNLEDLPGNFLLVPPAYSLEGVNAGTSDYIGVYASVVPAMNCESEAPPGVERSPAAIVDWLSGHPGLVLESQVVSVGGLDGMMAEMRVAPDWTEGCSYSNGRPIVPFLTGRPPSAFDHNLPEGQAIRLYLLSSGTDVLGIEVLDVADAQHFDEYQFVVDAFAFDG